MKEIIEIPQGHKRVIDNLVSDGKGYLLPHEVETRLAKAVKIGTVIPDDATNGDMIKAMFPNAKIERGLYGIGGTPLICVNLGTGYDVSEMSFVEYWWNAPYKGESGE